MPGVLRSASERARLLEAYKSSGLSAMAFAEREGISSSTLYQWLAGPRPKRAVPLRIAKVIRRAAPPSMSRADEAPALVIDLGVARVHVPRGFVDFHEH